MRKEPMANYFEGERTDKKDRIIAWLRDAEVSTPETTFRHTSMEDYRFYAGKQDSKEVLMKLAGQRRPASVYNEVKPKIDMLVGLAAQTKRDVNFKPVGSEDGPLAEVITSTVKHFRTEMGMSRRELECFEHTVKSGRSLLYFHIDKENPFEPTIKCRRIPGRQFYLDPESQEYDMSDARFLFLETFADEDTVKVRWPKFDVSQLASYLNGNAALVDGRNYGADDLPVFFNEARNKFRIIECWYVKMVDVAWFVNPINGKVENLPPKDFRKFALALQSGLPLGERGELVQLPVPEAVVQPKKEYWYRIFSGTTVLEEGKSQYKYEGFPAVLYGAYKDEDTNAWFGTITMQKDPQRGINTMRRQLSHLLQTLPKGMLVHEAGAILNIEEYEEKNADPSFHLEVGAGMLEKVKFNQQPQISPIYSQFSGEMSQSMKDASGIQNEMMGVETSSRTPGVTTRLRQETSLAVLYTLYDNYRESRNKGNKILLSMIQQYVTQPMVIRINKDAEQLLQINTQLNPQAEGFNDVTAGKYDLVVDEVIETASTRAGIMAELIDYSQNNPGAVPADVIFDYSDLPYSAKEKIKESSAAMAAGEQQEKDRLYQLELLKIQTKVDEINSANLIKEEELKIKKREPKATGGE